MYLTGVIVAFCISFIVLMYQSTIRIRNGEEKILYGLVTSTVASFVYSLLSWLTVFLFPYVYLKKRKRDIASKLFTSYEKSLLYNSQKVIEMSKYGFNKPDSDILMVAQLIENSRIEYQIMNKLESLDIAFMDLLQPRLELLKLEISDWKNVNKYFDFE